MDLSLFYFADDSAADGDRYRLLLEGAKFADAHNFTAVWTPERHFHPFGGLYPNPSVTSAALAAITQKVQIRAGSVVLPLHDPVRVAAETFRQAGAMGMKLLTHLLGQNLDELAEKIAIYR